MRFLLFVGVFHQLSREEFLIPLNSVDYGVFCTQKSLNDYGAQTSGVESHVLELRFDLEGVKKY